MIKTCLALIENSILRSAVQRNLVTFPSQVPAFVSHEEDNRRIVQLYFVRGWRLSDICSRYGICRSVVRGIISEWAIRAIRAGYIQEIDPDALELLTAELRGQDPVYEPAAPSQPDPVPASPDSPWEMSLSAAAPIPSRSAGILLTPAPSH